MTTVSSRYSPTTKLYINVSILSIALNATYFAFLIQSNKLYDIGKCWSSYVILLLPVIELLKHYYVGKVLQLAGWNIVFDLQSNASTSQKSGSKHQSKKLSPFSGVGGLLFILILSMLFYGFICLILGAPLDQYEETTSLAAALTTLTILPITLFIGHSGTIRLLFSEAFELRSPIANSYLTLLKNNCIGVILGAWGASVVAPLDWDRPWQVYPVPNVVGAIGGSFGMNVFTLLSTLYFILCKSNHRKGIV
ncbi:uncharacterized protein LOC131435243 [Malaya genurostris]|uniref:uncharacterized protein LOC131435243 n=1 Tax=Malaya genurostris TaxID=325434 RepID=UPI0026F3B944|nr:uncharacterized protein LOC131435243 [Malaya genurostris]XP_058458902.1 uncharacterized protein LOC131435243 [Malaya genurostris]XP_058458904.1 uncharacterized protein LOC131435243 [Malaya genurostris]XP_058458905.1 uncharacterized protein LOC131435243 [Malaya genurostris]